MDRSATLCGLRDLYNFQLLGNTNEQLKEMRRGTKKALQELYINDDEDEPKQAEAPKEANKKEKEKAPTHSDALMKALELKRQNAFYGEEDLEARQYRWKKEEEFLERVMMNGEEMEEGEIGSI